MSGLDRILEPKSIAIAGLSADPAKHGRRVLGHLQQLGYEGRIWGLHPEQPEVEGVELRSSLADLPEPPDLVVCAVPARAVLEIAAQAQGVGGLVVFAGGFAESGPEGETLEAELRRAAGGSGVRVLGPNSGGVIRPSRGLAASFLTCLDRAPGQIRSGPVGLVTQSGGTGSYLHNLAAARGSGLAVSVSTGNESDVRLGEAVGSVARLEEVEVVLIVVETVRDGPVFIEAVREARRMGKPVVACRIGTTRRGKALMITHTGAMAVREAVLNGVLGSLDVVVAETPGEAYDVAEMMARAGRTSGGRAAVVTHSGGVAILLADLAERHRLDLSQPGSELQARLDPLLDHGAANNPLDMGGIIGGPHRFAEVVGVFAGSAAYDMVLAVSTAHPPEHTAERVDSLLALSSYYGVPILHLWMAGDQGAEGLDRLRGAGAPVSEEPRAAVKALAALARFAEPASTGAPPEPLGGTLPDWGVPVIAGSTVTALSGAVRAAEELGYPVVLKLVSPGLAHKSEVGGVRLGLTGSDRVRSAYRELLEAASEAGLEVTGIRVEPYRPGLEMIVGGVVDPGFGPLVSVGLGGVLTEVLGDVAFAPAPVDESEAREMIDSLRGRRILDEFRGRPPADVGALARIVSRVSRGLVGSGLVEVEMNPLIWDGVSWIAVDWLTVSDSG